MLNNNTKIICKLSTGNYDLGIVQEVAQSQMYQQKQKLKIPFKFHYHYKYRIYKVVYWCKSK